MKNLAMLMQKGDLKPRERVLLLVHNYVTKDTTGMEPLTEAQKYSLNEGWRAKNNEEIREYNRYNNGWRTETGLKIDAQGIYLSAENSLLRASRVVDYALWKDYKDTDLKLLNDLHIIENEDEALELIIKNSGMVYDSVVHRHAFQSLSEDTQKDILALYPDAETENQYLDQEEIIAELLNGNNILTPEAKEKLAGAIVDTLHNRYSVILAKKGSPVREWWFSGYFAELPTIEIAKRWADLHKVSYQNDDKELESKLSEEIQQYAKKHKIEVREFLKKTIMAWLDDGLFVSEYTPIWNSSGKSTCNGVDTRLQHKDVLKAWIKAKTEAKATLEELVDTGKLEVEIREQDFYGMKENVKILTGKNLYNLDGDFIFAEDFKKQADSLKALGCLVIFLKERGFLEGYASLLAFAEIYKKLSRIYEIDLGYKVDAFIENFRESIEHLNMELRHVSERLEESIQCSNDIKFPVEQFIDAILIHLEEIPLGVGEAETYYAGEFKKILGEEF
jgi:hypothetical protein